MDLERCGSFTVIRLLRDGNFRNILEEIHAKSNCSVKLVTAKLCLYILCTLGFPRDKF